MKVVNGLRLAISLLLIVCFFGCSAQYAYVHESDGQRCQVAVDSLRDVPDGATVHIDPDCNVTVQVGPLRNGGSEAAQVLKAVIPLVEKAAGL